MFHLRTPVVRLSTQYWRPSLTVVDILGLNNPEVLRYMRDLLKSGMLSERIFSIVL